MRPFFGSQSSGGKVRAEINQNLYLDIHFDPTTKSYSYALIDFSLPYVGDKRLFGWDDFPHENIPRLKALKSYPHHFQKRDSQGIWLFKNSTFRGNIEIEMESVIAYIKSYLKV